MRKMPVIIAHYTLHTPYEEEVKYLLRSLLSLELEFDVEPIESLGTWRANSNYSIWLIEKMLNKYPKRAILKTDADAVFHKVPDLFLGNDFDCDFACRWQNFRYRKHELLGGTLYFANNKNARELLRIWKEKCIVNPTARNPDLLQEAINKMGSNINARQLPASYCKIFDTMRHIKNPVIEHFQASRRLKKIIDQMDKKERL